MPTFMTIHRSPGLSPEEIAANGPLVAESEYATFRHLYVDLYGGYLVSIYEATDQDAVEQEFERVGFPWDEIHEVHVDLGCRQPHPRCCVHGLCHVAHQLANPLVDPFDSRSTLFEARIGVTEYIKLCHTNCLLIEAITCKI